MSTHLTDSEGTAVPNVVESESPWYVAEIGPVIEDERPIEEPHVAQRDSPEWCLLVAYDGVRREVVDSPRPLENQLKRRRLLEQCVRLMVQYHGGAVLAGPLLALPIGGDVEVVRAPAFPSKMARHGKSNNHARVKPE